MSDWRSTLFEKTGPSTRRGSMQIPVTRKPYYPGLSMATHITPSPSGCHRSLQNVPPAVESKCTTPGRWFSRLGGLPLARTARGFLKWDAATACLGCSP
jgi:hypothetical protein